MLRLHLTPAVLLAAALALQGCASTNWPQTPELPPPDPNAAAGYITCLQRQALAVDDDVSPASDIAEVLVSFLCLHERENYDLSRELAGHQVCPTCPLDPDHFLEELDKKEAVMAVVTERANWRKTHQP